MITVHAEVVFRTQARADADRILTAIADIVMVEVDGSVGASVVSNPPLWPQASGPWQHPQMEGQ